MLFRQAATAGALKGKGQEQERWVKVGAAKKGGARSTSGGERWATEMGGDSEGGQRGAAEIG